jgi:hypothetical protein
VAGIGLGHENGCLAAVLSNIRTTDIGDFIGIEVFPNMVGGRTENGAYVRSKEPRVAVFVG